MQRLTAQNRPCQALTVELQNLYLKGTSNNVQEAAFAYSSPFLCLLWNSPLSARTAMTVMEMGLKNGV